jgi:transposase-like protein
MSFGAQPDLITTGKKSANVAMGIYLTNYQRKRCGMARNSKAAKVRKMLGDGVPPKEIAKRLGIKPQNVYNIKYQASKKQGVGALPKPTLIKSGIVTAPRKRSEPNVYIPSVDEFSSPDAKRIARQAEASGDFWLWATLILAATVVGVVIATF